MPKVCLMAFQSLSRPMVFMDTTMKFASFETIMNLYKYVIPVSKEQCTKQSQLGVNFVGGYVAGVFCAIVSHPTDNLVSFLKNAQGETAGDAVKKLGLVGLFTSLFISL